MIKKILVLGGSGYLGSGLVKFLSSQNNYRVTYACRKPNQKLNAEFLFLDILDRSSFKKISNNFDIFINCIGQVTNPFTSCYNLNTLGIKNLIDFISSEKRFIQISSVTVYGSSDYVNEESQTKPETEYAKVKLISENLIKQHFNDLIILRLSNLFGGFQKKGFANYAIKTIKSNSQFTFNNDGNLNRSFLHIDDCIKLIFQVIENQKIVGTYNLCGDKIYSIIEILSTLMKDLNLKFDINYSDKKPWENIEFIDDSKIFEVLNNHKFQKKNIIKYIRNSLLNE
tara:strand:- start:1806 stop:2657 length:852 start_codon:yes stop_codon:yes gene_type:complete